MYIIISYPDPNINVAFKIISIDFSSYCLIGGTNIPVPRLMSFKQMILKNIKWATLHLLTTNYW